MKTSVSMQQSVLDVRWMLTGLIIAIAALLLLRVLLFLLHYYRANRKDKPAAAASKSVKRRSGEQYLKLIDDLQDRMEANQISVRQAYQELSRYIREFVEIQTGVDVTKYTLEEIRREDLPGLEGLIEEYYEPEFARVSRGDVAAAIKNTRRVIETWNTGIGG